MADDPSDNDLLILVDSHDAVIGHDTKRACHDGDGKLHRAFSVFILDAEGKVLIQRRAAGKRLWAGYWSNSCCSHPRKGEQTTEAAERRIREELGIEADLEYLYKFEYQAHFGAAGSEYELCHVFVGRSDAPLAPDPQELDDWTWIEPQRLDSALADHPDRYTPWFKMEWRRIRDELAHVLA